METKIIIIIMENLRLFNKTVTTHILNMKRVIRNGYEDNLNKWLTREFCAF